MLEFPRTALRGAGEGLRRTFSKPLARTAGEGGPSPQGWVGEGSPPESSGRNRELYPTGARGPCLRTCVSPIWSLSASHCRTGMPGDHQVLVGLDDIGSD